MLAYVLHHSVVCGCCRGQHRRSLRNAAHDVAQALIVRPEIVSPVGDAVRLVDHQQAQRVGDGHEHAVHEFVIGQPFRRHQQRIRFAAMNECLDLRPIGLVGGVDSHRPHAVALRTVDLVAHQGQERRHDQRRAPPTLAQQPGGDEVDGALAPTRAFHDEESTPSAHKRVNGLPLAVAEGGGCVVHGIVEQCESVSAAGWFGCRHSAIVAAEHRCSSLRHWRRRAQPSPRFFA